MRLLEVETVVETIADEPVIETKMEVSNPESRELHTPKRSHLPFNVMMLKQDKLKWEENKRKRSMATEVPPEQVIEETIVVQEESDDIESNRNFGTGKTTGRSMVRCIRVSQNELVKSTG